MEMLKPLLAAILDEASFDLEYKETGHSGGSRRPSVERISAAELRELATRQGQQVLDRSVRVRASDQAMSGLVDALRQVLGRFIGPESDRIGHAFPVGAANSYGCHSLQGNGDLCNDEFTTSVQGFANALIQAAAIAGVMETVRSLADWERGEAIGTDVLTVVNNMFLDAPVSLGKCSRLIPLALTTNELPRLPVSGPTPAFDYLGLTLLSRRVSASPVFFRPMGEAGKPTVRSRVVNTVDLDVLCEAPSPHANRHVSTGHSW